MKIGQKWCNYHNNKKSGYTHQSMNPTQITIHNTANTAPTINEINYVYNQLTSPNYNGVANWHYAVDENEAIELLPLPINGWHAGDGSGDGNLKSLGIEICRSASGDNALKDRAIENAVELTASLCRQCNIPTNQIFFHYHRSGKHCPHDILDRWAGTNDEVLQTFRNKVTNFMNENPNGTPSTPISSPSPANPSNGNKNNWGDTMYNHIDAEGKARTRTPIYPNNNPNDSAVRTWLEKGEGFRITGEITNAGIKQYSILTHKAPHWDGCVVANDVEITGSNASVTDGTIGE